MTYGNNNNQLTGDGDNTFEFDEIGRVEKINTSTYLTYDIFNNMTGYGSFTYQYDADNNRVKKVENGETTYYVRSGLD
ncbi:MAG: hypothetical protein ACTSPQ_22085, partial [Candidatus Helarchaeota archaeon]